MNKAHSVLVVAFLCVVLAACQKNTPAKPPHISYGDVKPEILESEKVKYDLGFGLSVPDMVLYSNPDALAECTFPGLHVDNFIEVHVEVLPIYAFGSANTSGDYYAVSGYVVAHNASAFRMGTALKDSGWIKSDENKGAGDYVNYAAWFMSKMNIDFQLLAEDGSPVSNEKVNFFVTPEPSTSIGERTYTKGFTFSLQPALTVGTVKKETAEGTPAWTVTLLGCVGVGLNWNDSSSQVLPDQTFEMSTEPYNRTVFYTQKTNNITTSVHEDCSPEIARSDERFDFSWVWHVAPGAYSARDYGFGKMKMKVTVNPVLMGNIKACVTLTKKDKDDPQKIDYEQHPFDCNNMKFESRSDSKILEIPAMNRIPVGNVEFKNTTRNYVTDIHVYRNGEKDVAKEAYSTVEGYYDTNESVAFMLREGNYDVVYNIQNGDTGEVIGTFMIENARVTRDETCKISTMDGKRI